jgi:glycosyltransferase involved in cell wall biosynthesis
MLKIDKNKIRLKFVQHSANRGGAPNSLLQTVSSLENDSKVKINVIFIKSGPMVQEYKNRLVSKIIDGKRYKPFHGSEVSGMNTRLALRNIVGLFDTPVFVWKYLRKANLVYFNSSCLCFYALCLKMLSPKTRIIFHLREPLLRNIWGAIIRRTVLLTADQIIAISNHDSIEGAPYGRQSVIYNYTDSNIFRMKKKDIYYQSPFRIVYFARVTEENGIIDFVHIAKNMASSKLNFVVYGVSGNETEKIRKLITESRGFCEFNDMTSNVAETLAQANLTVSLFQAPHFSRTVIESAMVGTPSIIYDVGSLNESVIHNVTGYIVKDINEACDYIKLAWKDRNHHSKMGSAARVYAKEKFSEKNFYKIRDIIYEEAFK